MPASMLSQYVDALHGRAEQALYVFGTRANVPWSALRTASRAAGALRQPFDTLRRKMLAARLADRAKAMGLEIPREAGYRVLDSSAIPELAKAIEVSQQIVRERGPGAVREKPTNPFFPLLKRRDVPNYPELLEAAMSDGVLSAAAGYLGVLPRLFSINVWLTRPNLSEEGHYDSQLWHLDKPDTGIVTLFVNLSDAKEEHGPFTFLPADISRRVRNATRYDRHSILGDGRLQDDAVFKIAGQQDIQMLSGPTGTAGFVDTSTCLHCGSRCESGERWTMVFRFVPAHRIRFGNKGMYDGHRWGGDSARRLVLAGSMPAAA